MNTRLKNIQVLRIVACFGVFGVHVAQRLELSEGIFKLMTFGANGVYLFFMISGFVTFVSFKKNGKVNYVKYLCGRAIKILPCYYSVILYNYVIHTFFLKDIPYDPTSLKWLRYIFCINRLYLSGVNFWDNLSATWTISTFICFYLLAPLLYKIITNSVRAIGALGVMLILNKILTLPEPVKMLPYFLFGICIYYAWIEEKHFEFITVLSVLALLYGILYERLGIVIYVLIFGIIMISTQNFIVNSRCLNSVINFLDERSYTIYLVHAIVIEWFDRTKYTYVFWSNKVLAFIIIVFCTMIGVWVIYENIEVPIQRTYKNYLCKK